MTKLTKAQLQQRANLVAKLIKLEDAIKDAIDAYNVELEEVREFVEGITGAIDDYTGERSEKWHEGERAQAVAEWRDAWEGLSVDDIEHLDLELSGELDQIAGAVEG